MNPFTKQSGTYSNQASAGSYSHGTAQLTFRPSDAKQFTKFCHAEIPDADLYVGDDPGKYGRDSEPHITVLYGLSNVGAADVAEYAAHRRPVRVKLGKISRFESKDYDVLKVEVKSTQLHNLHNSIRNGVKNVYKFSDYKPHVTIAYVEKGAVKELDNDDRFDGKEFTFDRLTYRRKSGHSTNIQFTGSSVNPYTAN